MNAVTSSSSSSSSCSGDNFFCVAELRTTVTQPCFESFFKHRAKRGGSLFQGGSVEREGSQNDPPPGGGEAPPPRSRSDPYFGVGYPSVRRFLTGKLS